MSHRTTHRTTRHTRQSQHALASPALPVHSQPLAFNLHLSVALFPLYFSRAQHNCKHRLFNTFLNASCMRRARSGGLTLRGREACNASPNLFDQV